jgi:cytochrome P450
VTFPAGSVIGICVNDCIHGADGSDRFDISVGRRASPLTLGAGPHFCLGSQLARAELEEALAFLGPRLPHLSLDPSRQPGSGASGKDGEVLRMTWLSIKPSR